MNLRTLSSVSLLLGAVAAALAVPARSPRTAAQSTAPEIASRAARILKDKCQECHDGKFAFDAADPNSLVGKKLVVPGKSAASKAFQYMAGKDKPMPPKPKPALTADELNTIRQWIDGLGTGPAPKSADSKAASPDATSRSTSQAEPLSTDKSATAARALAIIKSNCSGCHNGSQYFDAANPKAMLRKGYFIGGDPEGSEGLKFVLGKMTGRAYRQMPPEPSPALAPEDQAVIRQWVLDGANLPQAGVATEAAGNAPTPAKASANRTFVTEEAVLKVIVDDLESFDEAERRYMRYYSIANLHRNPDLDATDLKNARVALEKLVNSLSWAPDMVRLKPLGPDGVVLRLDLRSVDWTEALWQQITAANPYGLVPRNGSAHADSIRRQTGAAVPYLRVDWFVATASVPPLYNEILGLPEHVDELAKRLGVDERSNIEQAKVVRFGRRQSGVSRNNRVGERHRSLFGSFWKSYDFAGNQGRQNIFDNPIAFTPDGGEYVFHLPNGMQGYYIATADGRRLDQAPSNIVRDLETAGKDPVIVNGLSCIACHSAGMKVVSDQVRPHLDTMVKSDTFDLDDALSLYKPANVLSSAFQSDMDKFQAALKKIDADLVIDPKEEPLSVLARRYLDDEGSMSLAQAAADCGLSKAELARRIGKSNNLERKGFNQLTVDERQGAGIKRDLWEENFGLLVREAGLGTYVPPTRTIVRGGAAGSSAAPVRLTAIQIGNITCANQAVMDKVRQNLVFWLSRSRQVKLVRVSTEADAVVRGTIERKDGEVTITLIEEKRKLREDITGLFSDIDFLTQQVADRMHHLLTGERLPAADSVGQAVAAAPIPRTSPQTDRRPSPVPAVPAFIPRDPIATLAGQLPSRGLAVSVDRGPNAEYRFGEEVVIGVRSDRAGFLTIYNIDSQGTVALLFPNQFAQDNRVAAGQLVTVGGPAAPFQIQAQGVPGRETVVALITDESGAARLPGVAEFRREPGSKSLGVVARGVDSFRSDLTKSLGVVSRPAGQTATAAQPPPPGVAQAIVQFFTVR